MRGYLHFSVQRRRWIPEFAFAALTALGAFVSAAWSATTWHGLGVASGSVAAGIVIGGVIAFGTS